MRDCETTAQAHSLSCCRHWDCRIGRERKEGERQIPSVKNGPVRSSDGPETGPGPDPDRPLGPGPVRAPDWGVGPGNRTRTGLSGTPLLNI